MKNNLVVLINPGHDDNVPDKIARSFGSKSRDISREDPPLSLLNLGAFIRDRGYDVRIVDTHIEPNYKEIINEFIAQEPLIIGVSVILGKYTKNAISLTKFIKNINPQISIVWGGKLVHLAADKILKELDVNYIVIGEGEWPLLYLLNALRAGKDIDKIPGIGFKKGQEIIINENTTIVSNLDDLYQSRDFGWDLVKNRINFRQIPYFINLYTSRGCKFNCSFCYLRDVEQMGVGLRYRRRSAENVIKEMEHLNANYGINVFTFGDDDFLCEMQNVLPVLEYIRERKFYIEHFWTHIHNLNIEIIEKLKGICQTICYSIETISPRLQKILKKTIATERILFINKSLRQAGINTVHNFLFGIPTEKDEDTKQNIDLLKLLKKVNPHVRANCYILSPIPETPIFDYGQKISGKDAKWTLDDLANFHFRYMGESAAKFRPYLSAEDNEFYETTTVLANELFAEINQPASIEQRKLVNNSKRLKYIFGDLDGICYPQEPKKKYILNQVIAAVDNNRPLPKLESF